MPTLVHMVSRKASRRSTPRREEPAPALVAQAPQERRRERGAMAAAAAAAEDPLALAAQWRLGCRAPCARPRVAGGACKGPSQGVVSVVVPSGALSGHLGLSSMDEVEVTAQDAEEEEE